MKKINRIRNRKKVVVLLMALSLFTSYCLSTTTVSATPKQLQNELVESTKTVPLNDEPLESRVGATYKMGNKVLVNTDIFEAYLEQYRIPGDYEGMAKKFTPDLVELYQ